ncbi:rho guanine nucleotide exchange factor 28, partial [Plectropomus leopardus]|uniref:rho guanine nucleotide exchange factor 28 n=1 Tax=Plectropomus leopardus TaxID=160734 RepID=UPI001C4B5045
TGISKEVRVEEHALVDNVFEEQLVLSLDDDDDEEECPSSISVNGHPMQSSGVQSQFTQHATDPLLSVINSSVQTITQRTQEEDTDIKYSVSGVTRDSTGTDSGLWDTVDSEDLLLATDTPPPYSEDFYPPSLPCFPALSPPDQALARLNRPASSELTRQRESPPMDTCDLSPSLVALEMDSEEDSTEPKSPFSPLSSDEKSEKSEDKRESFRPSPDLTCTRSQSASSACEPTTKELGDQGIRLRSYSYSSPKISLRPARFARDNHTSEISPDAVLHSVSHSRSLLQALSLSKSLSLLHPGKQRASSISEQSHEKREIKFRKRAQSADDEGSMELAESLQHLTLSEFLKEIEEEELDKYNIPTKVESEKYKVIRTFSFLKSRMSSTRNKTKGKGKDREAKDRQMNGHRFNTGACLGPNVCVVCEKPASGKDLLHCSGCTTIVHKSCKESVPPCLKKLQDKYAVTMVKNRTASLPQNFTVRDSPPQCVIPISTSLPIMKDTATQSCPVSGILPNSDSRLSESPETESDSWKVTSRSEELLPTPDQKPPVIALQKLIVREVANEERGMFLISASAAGPEMYEVHTSSKEERNTWMRLIREAVESCPEEEEEYTSESEEEKRAAEARIQKIHKLQESLMSQDQRICSSLEEKLQVYAELSALSGRTDASLVEPRLLVSAHTEELPQAAVLLTAALREVENLKATLSSKTCSPSSHSPDSDTDSVFPVSPAAPVEPPSDSEASPENPEAGEESSTESLVLQSPTLLQKTDTNDIDFKVAQSVQSLTQLLYSLQAAVTIQDTCYKVQRLFLQETGRPSPRAQRPHLSSIRGNTLQEQEKQRNLEKRKEEVAEAQRLQERLRQEKERWERECQARESQQGEQESRLEERERQCHLETERLRREREELDEQLEEYQQSLERLREGQRSVERERERLENQQKLLQTWRHSRQRSLPAVIPHMVIPLDGQQDSTQSQSREHAGNGSVFVNEAALTSTSINNRHVHHKRNDPSAHNCLNTLLARSNSRQPPMAKTPHSPHSDSQGWMMGTGYLYSPAGRLELQHTASDLNSHNYIGETWSSTASGPDPYPVLPHPGDPQLDLSALVSLETDSGGEEGSEETIVYL